jgi:hypothetical protein
MTLLMMILVVLAIVYILPIMIIATNKNVGQIEKLLYVCGIVFFTPIVFIIYLALAKPR